MSSLSKLLILHLYTEITYSYTILRLGVSWGLIVRNYLKLLADSNNLQIRSFSPADTGYRYSFLFIPFLLLSCQLSDSLPITTYPSIPFSHRAIAATLSHHRPTTPHLLYLLNLLHLPYQGKKRIGREKDS